MQPIQVLISSKSGLPVPAVDTFRPARATCHHRQRNEQPARLIPTATAACNLCLAATRAEPPRWQLLACQTLRRQPHHDGAHTALMLVSACHTYTPQSKQPPKQSKYTKAINNPKAFPHTRLSKQSPQSNHPNATLYARKHTCTHYLHLPRFNWF